MAGVVIGIAVVVGRRLVFVETVTNETGVANMSSTPKRRWYQFSLRMMFVVVTPVILGRRLGG